MGRDAQRWTDFLIFITKLSEESILESVLGTSASGDDTIQPGEDLILCMYIDVY